MTVLPPTATRGDNEPISDSTAFHKVEMKLFLKYWWGLNQVKDCLVCFGESSLRHQLLKSNTRLLSLDFQWESFRIVSRTADETVHKFSVSSERQWGQRSRSTLVTLRPASLSRPRLSEEIICSSVTNVCLRSSLLLSGFCSVESTELLYFFLSAEFHLTSTSCFATVRVSAAQGRWPLWNVWVRKQTADWVKCFSERWSREEHMSFLHGVQMCVCVFPVCVLVTVTSLVQTQCVHECVYVCLHAPRLHFSKICELWYWYFAHSWSFKGPRQLLVLSSELWLYKSTRTSLEQTWSFGHK